MERRKRSTADAHSPELSPDIVFFQILPRLPVKSIFRFKLVSKEWHSFLTTPAFVKMHLHHHHNVISNNYLVMLLSSTTPYKFHIIDCENPKKGISPGRPFPFKLRPRESVRVLSSAHGLVCLGIGIGKVWRWPRNGLGMPNFSDLILWNPATTDFKKLSRPVNYDDREDFYTTNGNQFGLYHSSWDDDYKLVRVSHHSNVYIYSLKSNSWRKVVVNSDFRPTPIGETYIWGPYVCLNENLYILEYIALHYSYLIVRFDTKTETLKSIPTPFSGNNQSRRITWLSFKVDDKKRCIDLWVNIENSGNELWRMDGDGEGDIGDWTKVENYAVISSDPLPIRCQQRLHLMRNGNMLMYGEGCIYQLDLKTHTKDVCSYTTEEMRSCPRGEYIETMVSPNQYVK